MFIYGILTIELPKRKVHLIGIGSNFYLLQAFLSHYIFRIGLTFKKRKKKRRNRKSFSD